jgi:hypothetical protein
MSGSEEDGRECWARVQVRGVQGGVAGDIDHVEDWAGEHTTIVGIGEDMPIE